MKGWSGLAWLFSFNWSSIPICLLIALSISLLLPLRRPRPKRMLCVAFSFSTVLAGFIIARWIAFEWLYRSMVPNASAGFLITLLLSSLVLSLSLFSCAHHWLTPLRIWGMPLLFGSLFLAVGLSFITIRVFPAISGSTDSIHAFKMGYPVFWMALLMPYALRLSCAASMP